VLGLLERAGVVLKVDENNNNDVAWVGVDTEGPDRQQEPMWGYCME
jgi:hypothetical protein